jgi:rare lipoprotein A
MSSSGFGPGFGLWGRLGIGATACLLLAHCGQAPGRLDPKYGVSASPRLVDFGEPVPKGGGSYRVGKPYTVGGRIYSPEENSNYSATGTASWYGDDFHGRQTANGEIFDMTSISAAHPTLPIPSYARVTNLENRRSIIVRVNDRGPYHEGRLIDVSVRAAKLLGFYDVGVAPVRVDYVGRASLAGSDDAKLEATLRNGTRAPGLVEVRTAAAHGAEGRLAGSVPVPADRPFELGQVQGSQHLAGQAVAKSPIGTNAAVNRAPLAPPRQPQTAVARALPAPSSGQSGRSFASRFEPAATLPRAPSGPEPISAFAPGSAQGASATGRGLY